MSIAPSELVMQLGSTRTLSALAVHGDYSTEEYADLVEWSSSRPEVADFVAPGEVLALRPGTAELRATDPESGKSAVATVTVTDSALQSVEVQLSSISVPRGAPSNAKAFAVHDDGSRYDVTSQAEWGSSEEDVATVSPSGDVLALSAGATRIEALYDGITGAADFQVGAAELVSLEITGQATQIPQGGHSELLALGEYTDGSILDFSSALQWSSSDPEIAEVQPSGRVVGKSAGTVVVEGTDLVSGKSSTVELTVTDAVPVSLAIAPVAEGLPLVGVGEHMPLLARVAFSDGTDQVMTDSVCWVSSNDQVITVDEDGVILGLEKGVAEITASLGAIEGTVQAEVRDAVLERIELSATRDWIRFGYTVPIAAIGHYSDGSTKDFTSQVDWSSSDTRNPVSNQRGAKGLMFGLNPNESRWVLVTASLGTSHVATHEIRNYMFTAGACSPHLPSISFPDDFSPSGRFHFRYIVKCDGSDDLYDLSEAATWTSSDSSYVAVSDFPGSKGFAQFIQSGPVEVQIRASVPGGIPAVNWGVDMSY